MNLLGQKNATTLVLANQGAETDYAKIMKALSREQLIETESTRWLERVINRVESCIVVGDEGAGKATAAQWCFDNVMDCEVLTGTPAEIFSALWDLEEWPLDASIQAKLEFDIKNFMTNKHGYKFAPIRCHQCPHRCKIAEQGICMPDDEDFISGYIQVASKVECKVIQKMALGHLDLISVEVPIILEFSDINLLPTISGLNCIIIILCTPTIYQAACKRMPELKDWPSFRFPPTLPTELLQMLKARVGDLEIPLSERATHLIATLSNENPGIFFKAITKLIDHISLNPERGFSVTDLFSMLSMDIDEQLIIGSLVSTLPPGWMPASKLLDMLQNHGMRMDSKRLGQFISKSTIRKRTINGRAEYFVGENNVKKLTG